MSVVTKRQLAARFVDQLGRQPLPQLAAGLMAAAQEAGYTKPAELTALIAAVEYELQQRRGAVEVRLTTAHELPVAEMQEVATSIASALGAASHSLVHQVDPDLIGGFEAEAGDSAIYASIRSNLNSMETTHA